MRSEAADAAAVCLRDKATADCLAEFAEEYGEFTGVERRAADDVWRRAEAAEGAGYPAG